MSVRSELFLRALAVLGFAIVVFANGAALYVAAEPFRYWDIKAILFVAPIVVSAVTLVIGLGIALYFVFRSHGSSSVLSPRIRAALSNRAFVGVAVAIAIFLWSYMGWCSAYLIDRGLQGFPSPSAFNFDLVLGVPLGVLLPLGAGWIFYAAMHLAPPADNDDAHQAIRFLGSVLAAFGMLWVAFAGACTLSGGFSGMFMIDRRSLPIAALILAYGGVFLIVGWHLSRRRPETSGAAPTC